MPLDIYQEKVRIISVYANDIHKALWYDEVCTKIRTKKMLNIFV